MSEQGETILVFTSPVTSKEYRLVFDECLTNTRIARHVETIMREELPLIDLIKKYSGNDTFYVKIKLFDEYFELFNNEVNNYKLFNENQLVKVPKLIDHCSIPYNVHVRETDKNGDEDEYEATFLIGVLVTENCGKTLAEIYGIYGKGPGPGFSHFVEDNLIDEIFPSDKVPEPIRQNIMDSLQIMKNHGFEYQDIHGGNFLLKEGQLYIIDMECVDHV